MYLRIFKIPLLKPTRKRAQIFFPEVVPLPQPPPDAKWQRALQFHNGTRRDYNES